MAEYIDRGIAIAKLTALEVTDRNATMTSAKRSLADMPAADVAPVRHGRWVDNHCTACGMMPMGDEMWEICDFEPPRFEKFMDYCPNCGAKMDGGVDDACL